MRQTVISAIIFAITLPLAVYLAIKAPEAEGLGGFTRILYIHVPCALAAVLSFLLSGFHAAMFLHHGGAGHSSAFHAGAKLGVLFTIITTVTGSAWARLAWGSWWNWDTRESSIVFLLLVYIAYFVLRTALRQSSAEERISAAYLLFAAAVMPFFVFAAPRIYDSLHPNTILNAQGKIQLETSMRIALLFSAISITALFSALYHFMKTRALHSAPAGDSDE